MQVDNIKELIPAVVERYGLTHRIDVRSNLTEFFEVMRWLEKNKIKCSVPQGFSYRNNLGIIYIAERDLTAFLLRWG